MKDRGLETLTGLQWPNLKGELLAELRGMMRSNVSGKMVFLGQHNLAGIILEHIAKYPNIKVIFSHCLVGLRQTEKGVTALFLTPEGEKFITAEYLAWCDGAGSAVRHCLCIPFEAFTGTDFRFITSNMHYDFVKEASFYNLSHKDKHLSSWLQRSAQRIKCNVDAGKNIRRSDQRQGEGRSTG